jgi:hypothetical protein
MSLNENKGETVILSGELHNWPVQLQFLNPNAPYLNHVDLLITADCVPFAYANFYQRFLKDKEADYFLSKT